MIVLVLRLLRENIFFQILVFALISIAILDENGNKARRRIEREQHS